jgi:3-deoxy-D-manno-octulosonic-acid transferase
MRLLYTALILSYGMALRVAALFNHKARLWVDGRTGWYDNLRISMQDVDPATPRVWFHASSLGEFEQGRPIMEAYREANPDHFIVVTFFSPSGYEVRKNYPIANRVFYLPLDTRRNARRWLTLVNPRFAMFIKYDFWFNFLHALKTAKIPVYFASALFRRDHYFFRWYGAWFRQRLGDVTWFFVQNAESEGLLKKIGRENVTLTGDTRFDRVFAIARKRESFPDIERFAGDQKVFIGGSTWKEDENLVLPLIAATGSELKFILAPHDTSPERIQAITSRLIEPFILHSQLTEENSGRARILIIDSVGILSRLYRYATLAFIGGGFGVSIHNIQEPITFGVPVFFGPHYRKFKEATDLVNLGAAFPVENQDDLIRKVKELLSDPSGYKRISAMCKEYVDANRGATERIMHHLSH